ncbi:dihydrolipoyl dehydrogenase [Bacillus cereus]
MKHLLYRIIYLYTVFQFYCTTSQVIEEDLYGEEEDILNWQDLMERYQIVATKSGIKFREKEELVEEEWL